MILDNSSDLKTEQGRELHFKDSCSENAVEIECLPGIPDGYELLEKLGEGGMGVVYKIKDLNLNEYFAIKIFKQDLSKNASALKRFNQEIDAAAALSHINLISIHKIGTTANGEPYLVMDYAEGTSLANLIETGNDFSANSDRLLNILIQICEGLEHAHKNGVIHRDIKPSNILITKDADGEDVVKIVDFGIARILEESNRATHNLTQTGEVFGSPHYMSPEQCLGLKLTQHSDIYSLGCTMYETVTNKPPFDGANPIQLVVKHINENATGFDKDLKGCQTIKQLETVTLKCLSKEIGDRYVSISALKEDLGKVREGKPVPKYRVNKRTKPNLTRSQMFIYAALGMAIASTICNYSTYLNLDKDNMVGILFSILIGPGFVALIIDALKRYNSIRQGKNSACQWWIMLMALSAGLGGLSFTPYAIGLAWFGGIARFPASYSAFADLISHLHIPCLFLLLASALCWSFFKAKSASLFYIGTRLIPIILATITTLNFLTPSFISRMKDRLALSTSELAFLTGRYPRYPRDTLREATRLSYKGADDKALSLLENGLATEEDEVVRRFYRMQIADLYVQRGNYIKALEYLEKSYSERLNIPYDNEYILQKARIYHGQSKLNEARKWLRLRYFGGQPIYYPYSSLASNREALIYCSESKFDKAKQVLNEEIEKYGPRGTSVLLRAILEEQTGEIKKAAKDFKSIVFGSMWRDKGSKLPFEDYLQIAYSMKRLGNEEEYIELMKMQKGERMEVTETGVRRLLELVDDAVKLKIDDPPLSEAK